MYERWLVDISFNTCLYWYRYCSCSLPDFTRDVHVCMPRIIWSYKICRYLIYVIAEHADTVLSEDPSTKFADRANSVTNNFNCVDSNVTYPRSFICVIYRIMHELPWITILRSWVRRFDNNFHEWRMKIIGKSHHERPKIVIHGNECIILFLTRYFVSWTQFS